MTAPRLEIDLTKIQHNTSTLVGGLSTHGISVTGVTKAMIGSPDVAQVFLRAGVQSIGDSRIENIEVLRQAGVKSPISLIRSPMISQVDRVVKFADYSFNTEFKAIRALSDAAKKADVTHGIVLMIELGDIREGIMPDDLHSFVHEMLRLPNIELKGIGANLACFSGTIPDSTNMARLSSLADSTENQLGKRLEIVSGGNSASVRWAMNGNDPGKINNLRLGESLLLGRDPLDRQPIENLYTDAFTLVAEVIESKFKPSRPEGPLAQTAFGQKDVESDRGLHWRSILSLGHQDTDPSGIHPLQHIEILGAGSDHLVVDSGGSALKIGGEVSFVPNYSALMRAMAAPTVTKILNP